MATLEETLILDSKSQLPHAKKSKTVVPLFHLGMLTPLKQNKEAARFRAASCFVVMANGQS